MVLMGATVTENNGQGIVLFMEKIEPGLVVFDFDGALVYSMAQSASPDSSNQTGVNVPHTLSMT